MNSRRTTLIIAIVVAAAVGFLTVRYLTSVAPTPTAVVDTRDVVVAAREIHTREKITQDMLISVRRPVDQIEQGAVTNPKAADGEISLISIPEGAQITDSKIARPATVGLPGKLVNGMRAVSIPMDYIKSVSGLVNPGDRVDVMASYTRGGGKAPPTRTIIRGAIVLAVNSTLEPTDTASAAPGSGPAAPAAVTLEVNQQQADLLTYADMNTTIRLALVGVTEPKHEAVEPLVIPDVAVPTAPPAPVAAAAPPAVAAPLPPTPAPKPSVILVIIGDQAQGGSR